MTEILLVTLAAAWAVSVAYLHFKLREEMKKRGASNVEG